MPQHRKSHDTAVDLLRHAVQTTPMDSWYLLAARNIIRHAPDYRPRNSNGYFSWDFTIETLRKVVAEGWLTHTEGRYLPTDAAKHTWTNQTP
ncbi:hypothetical protein ACH4VR_29665 [Streptomyces sp. NPDC020883]|uniref:hypothetical protein n=1 Tax=Streptomyces sp. NPDC020883 TaxID=3365099 RepID=UPI0037ADECFB